MKSWGIRPWQFAAFLASCVVIILRRPDAVFHPQFFAEDGAIWYATAYNYGWWRVLFSPYEGYIHLVPRLTAGIALLFPVAIAPLIENLIAIVIQALPVSLLLSRRAERWGTLRFRTFLAFLYLVLPNTREMIASVTESQWILALCVLLVLSAQPPQTWRERVSDFFLLALCALTGPFCILLLAPAMIIAWSRRNTTWPRFTGAILIAGALAQTFSLVVSRHRPHPRLGAGLLPFLRILSGQVYLGALLGSNGAGTHISAASVICIAMAGSAIVIYCFCISGLAMRAMLVLSTLVFLASLSNPTAFPPPGHTAWEMLTINAGIRYWFFPCLTFVWSIAQCLRTQNRSLRVASTAILALIVVGIVRDFRYPPFPDRDFKAYADQLRSAPPGATVVVPIEPTGWHAVLVKH